MHGQKNKFPTRKKGQPATSTSDIKLPKIPRIEMPEDFKIRTQPLFSLPQEVLKLPPPPKKTGKSQVKQSAPRRKSTGHYFFNLIFKINYLF